MKKVTTKKFITGEKFGKLTIICLAKAQQELIFICQCDCFQIVKVSREELLTRTACLNCEARNELKKFAVGDIVIFRHLFGEIPFGEETIVHRIIDCEVRPIVEIEYRGRTYKCRPDLLENTGVKF